MENYTVNNFNTQNKSKQSDEVILVLIFFITFTLAFIHTKWHNSF